MQSENQGTNSPIVRSGEVSKRLGITNQTIRRWVSRYAEFFSETAKLNDKYKVGYTEEDLVIIATIYHFSAKGIRLDDIENQLRGGVRYGAELAKAITADEFLDKVGQEKEIDPKLVQLELKQTRMERDQALNALYELKGKYESSHERIEALLEQLAALQYRLGVAEGELNLLRRQSQGG